MTVLVLQTGRDGLLCRGERRGERQQHPGVQAGATHGPQLKPTDVSHSPWSSRGRKTPRPQHGATGWPKDER